MRKLFVALLLLVVGVGAASMANLALAQDNLSQEEGLKKFAPRVATRVARLTTSVSPDNDTTYVGFTPGKKNNPAFPLPNNYWSLYSGRGVADGYHRPGNAVTKGLWTFETAINGDSLQGWWSARVRHSNFTGNRLDVNRPWTCIDVGNNANYISLGAGSPSSKRTTGVVGVWHRDNGNVTGNGVTWAPLGGSFSAWMGLRRHGDVTFKDAITGNPFNDDVKQFDGIGPTISLTTPNDFGYPGYGNQMDQMLYRDIDGTGHGSDSLTISYTYRTNMSTGFGTNNLTSCGWFDKDPLGVPLSNNNFISAQTLGSTPRDSFMVYIGAPVGASFKTSIGSTQAVFDPQRRWFGEVIKANEAKDTFWRSLASKSGVNAPTTEKVTLSAAQLAPLLSNGGNKLRLVFRVKTNRGFDDEDGPGTGFSSGGAGAAVVDNVYYKWSSAAVVEFGEFEAAGDIDNSNGVDPLNAWKSTGKPPALMDHIATLSNLPYEDVCGQPGDPSRNCDLDGHVIVAGFADYGNAAGGLDDNTAERNLNDIIISPTIQLIGPYTDGGKNVMGIYAKGTNGGIGDTEATDDYYLDYEMYEGITDPFTKGNGWRFGIQSYPANDQNGNPDWGPLTYLQGIFFTDLFQCFRDFEAVFAFGGMRTSNTSGIPDSLRMVLGKLQQCYRFGVSTGCSPTDGLYWDNVSLALIDGTPALMSVDIWQWINDTFPSNDNAALPGVAARFDTTAAIIKTGLNTAPSPGTTSRFDVPGDSTTVIACGNDVRVDMIFRILPGPGNYVTVGRPDVSNLRKVPNDPTQVTAGDLTNFWSNYMADAGEFASGGSHSPHPTAASGPLAGQKIWDPNKWNSARCDSSDTNLFPIIATAVFKGIPNLCFWQSTYHESEAKGVGTYDPQRLGRPRQLGVERRKCFVSSTSAAITDVDCVHDPGTFSGAIYDLRYVSTGPSTPNATSGYDGHVLTPEGTKIIPDGQLTPGSHVEYFFRRSAASASAAQTAMVPDTTTVSPQNGEGPSTDGHRWQEFSVLPDRWKDPAYKHPVTGTFGLAPACLLVVDSNDRRGNERAWVSVADTIGATSATRYGAHNGWHAIGGADINDPANNRTSDGRHAFTAEHLGQPGSNWDFYQSKASESLTLNCGSIGSRFSFRNGTNTQIDGKSSRQGPTIDMMNAYYKMIFLMSGDLNLGVLGPYSNRSQNDVKLLEQWLLAGNTSTADRGIWVMGDGFAESNFGQGGDQAALCTNFLGINLRDPSYVTFTGNGALDIDLRPFSAITTTSDIYGMRNLCLWTNDILERNAGLISETADATKYQDAGAGPFPLLSGVAKNFSTTHPWIALTDGWDIEHLTSRFDNDTRGRSRYFYEVFTGLFAGLNCALGTPAIVLDVPNTGGDVAVDFARLYGNPLDAGSAVFSFGLARDDQVEIRVYDVGGRLIKTLADQRFKAGEHRLTWDGLDNSGRRVARGVYFARVRYKSSLFNAANKIIMLK